MATKLSKNDEWWAGLTISQKERIARKAASVQNIQMQTAYPACSRWWITLEEERKTEIRDHCTDHHGYLLADFREVSSLSY